MNIGFHMPNLSLRMPNMTINNTLFESVFRLMEDRSILETKYDNLKHTK